MAGNEKYGLCPWNRRGHTEQQFQAIKAVLDRYRHLHAGLSSRTMLYRCMAAQIEIYNQKTGETTVCGKEHGALINNYLAWGRRCGDIGWDQIADTKGKRDRPYFIDHGLEYINDCRDRVHWQKLDRRRHQRYHMMLWCESEGTVPLLEGLAREYGLELWTGKGYDSVKARYDIATLARARSMRRKRLLILHVGDHDPSGVVMPKVLINDVRQMIIDLDAKRDREWGITRIRKPRLLPSLRRVAITEQQVEELGLSTGTANRKDSRYKEYPGINGDKDATCELEAMDPNDLIRIVTAAIEADLNLDALKMMRRREKSMHKWIHAVLDGRKRLKLTKDDADNADDDEEDEDEAEDDADDED